MGEFELVRIVRARGPSYRVIFTGPNGPERCVMGYADIARQRELAQLWDSRPGEEMELAARRARFLVGLFPARPCTREDLLQFAVQVGFAWPIPPGPLSVEELWIGLFGFRPPRDAPGAET